jgi:flagellar biosynthetic protein FliR
MTLPIGPDTILYVFFLFCRIGGCMMLMPGISSTRIPMQVRLFIAIAVTLALTPLLLPTMAKALPDPAPVGALLMVVSETAIGGLIGVMARIFFLALQFMATAAAMYVGYGNMSGAPIEDPDPQPSFAILITLTATLLLFLTDQHWEILRALVASYSALPIGQPVATQFSVIKLADVTSNAFILGLQISAPFLVYSLIVNLMVGIANKLTPQIPVYFISIPFVLAGGLFTHYFTVGEFLRVFITGFTAWLATG